MAMILQLREDRLSASSDPVYLPAVERALYVLDGEATVEFPDGCSGQSTGSAWLGSSDIAILAKGGDVRLLRWELVAGDAADQGLLRSAPGAVSELLLSAGVELDTRFGWLMRCDRVGFPKGGIAYTHVHQGPGIRYCLEGRIEIETEGSTHEYGPGEPWFESGSSPVLAPTSKETETAFVRCFVLPRSCKSRTSIRYVKPEDASRPKTQRYKVLGERFIDLPVR
jgi:hypothetical protein